MEMQENDLDKKPEGKHGTEKGTMVSVAVVGAVILLVYVLVFGLYMSRV